MALGEDAGEQPIEHPLLADDDPVQLQADLLEPDEGEILLIHWPTPDWPWSCGAICCRNHWKN